MGRVSHGGLCSTRSLCCVATGAFSVGHLLEEAYEWMSVLEATCTVQVVDESTRDELRECREGSDRCTTW